MPTNLNPRPVTWLSLDRWGQLIGINPLHFNQLFSDTMFNNNVCGEGFFQDSFHHSDRVGRNDILYAIQQAEQEIAAEVGYNLLPDWTVDERMQYPRPGYSGVYNLLGTNPQGKYKSIEVPRGHVIVGGVKAKTLLAAAQAIVRTDVDGDGYNEKCTVTLATSVTDTNQIRVYHVGQDGDDGYEIRPINVSIAAGVATITFKAWQVVDVLLQEQLNSQPLDAALAASYETTCDIYQVYNDPQTQVQLMWDGSDYILSGCGSCSSCQGSVQTGCLSIRDQRMGFVVPSPGVWNASTNLFDYATWDACREPDQVRLWYLSGWANMSLDRPYVNMDPYWEKAVAYYAASKLDRPVCGCSNVSQFIDMWRSDVTFADDKSAFQNISAEKGSNHFGSSRGAIYAWQRVQQNGKKVNK